jgi:hypothetical protein
LSCDSQRRSSQCQPVHYQPIRRWKISENRPKTLLNSARGGEAEALALVREFHPRPDEALRIGRLFSHQSLVI